MRHTPSLGDSRLDLTRSATACSSCERCQGIGLAGLRISYAVGAPAIVAEVEKSRGPYKVSVAAERAALAALAKDRAWVAARIGGAGQSHPAC